MLSKLTFCIRKSVRPGFRDETGRLKGFHLDLLHAGIFTFKKTDTGTALRNEDYNFVLFKLSKSHPTIHSMKASWFSACFSLRQSREEVYLGNGQVHKLLGWSFSR